MAKIRVLIAGDSKLNSENWMYILNQDVRFMADVSCAAPDKIIELAQSKLPDVVIMDISSPSDATFTTTQLLRERQAGTEVIAVSSINQTFLFKKIMRSGAKGYITKNSSRQEVIDAIVEVSRGNQYVCTEMKDILCSHMLNEGEKAGPAQLTNREMEVINFVKAGNSSKEIAKLMNITFRTVEVHRHNILRKLKLKNTVALVNYLNQEMLWN